MQPLDKTLRSQLERTVIKARRVAEEAAHAMLDELGVGAAEPYEHLTEADRDLRRRLRIHGRQLGDLRDASGEQEVHWLAREVAYEHWHRMLFARFLAENDLLMYPDPDEPVAITLEECEELAADEGASDGWELAARYAARMLPQIFRNDSPVFELRLSPEHQRSLENLLGGLPVEVFKASDSLGWVYQFWQSENKERINKSEVKIGARELPAVTQLFTEPYMVSFLLDNSLGAWWAARRLTDDDLKNAESEEELREKAAIPGVPLEYLRFVKEDGAWALASGTYDAWPENLADLKTLDPCCGSGHFLVSAFHMLVPMRMKLESLSASGAVDVVLRENLHGLELDQRCVELAAFALALSAWTYPAAGGYRPLPELHLACSGLSVSVAKEEWKQLGLGKKNLTIALDWMHDTFRDAPVLGSLLNPAKAHAAKVVKWEELSGPLRQALESEQKKQGEELREATVVARGLAKTAEVLSFEYQWVITNVPYLGQAKHGDALRSFCRKEYPEAKSDLATVFLHRCLELCAQGGVSSVVLPQNWLFLTSYKKFREKMLKEARWKLLARLGSGAFETISGEVVKAILLNIVCDGRDSKGGDLFDEPRRESVMRGIDVSDCKNTEGKTYRLINEKISSVFQESQFNNPDSRIAFEESGDGPLLSEYADSYWGLGSGDGLRFCRKFYEVPVVTHDWEFLHVTFTKNESYTGMKEIVYWQGGKGELYEMAEAAKKKLKNIWQRGREAWDKNGVAVSQMGSLPRTLYTGHIFQNGVAAIIPKKEEFLKPIFAYCSSAKYVEDIRRIDQKLAVTNLTLTKVPFDIEFWAAVAEKKYPFGLPRPFSNNPSEWIFHGHPCGSIYWDGERKWTAHGAECVSGEVLQVAVARLLGFRWPAEFDPDMKLAEEQRELVRRCTALSAFADEDGIVCIPPVRGEASASDRLLKLLAASYGKKWTNDTLGQLLASADHSEKTLESWFREKFFTQHCKLFQHRPFIWQIWDGLKDGFSVLVNYHKFDYKLLETLIYTYLGDWISRQKQDRQKGVDGAEEKLAAAESLKKKLELILEGEAPYDIFVRWKPIEEQPIGWNPDLNDGVRLNIRPFMTAPDVKKKGAGVLRDKPNIKWTKDRGKDVESAPWYHEFGGERINDHHLTLEQKRKARKLHKEEK